MHTASPSNSQCARKRFLGVSTNALENARTVSMNFDWIIYIVRKQLEYCNFRKWSDNLRQKRAVQDLDVGVCFHFLITNTNQKLFKLLLQLDKYVLSHFLYWSVIER